MTKEKIKDSLKFKHLLTVIISLLGVLGSLASIYAIISSQRKVSLQCDIISITNVLDINTDISDLDILFKQKSLKAENKNLKLVIIKIKNNGTEDILKTFYDENAKFGIFPKIGEIIEKPEVIETSNHYLKRNLDIQLDTLGAAYFSKVIIDVNEHFTFKLLTLVNIGTTPEFEIVGKIAGIKGKINLSLFEPEIDLPFLEQVFLGNILVQIVKSIIYFLIMVLLIVVITTSSDKFTEWRIKKNRLKKIEQFKKSSNYTFKNIDSVIFDYYANGNDHYLLSIQEDLTDINSFSEKYFALKENLKKEKEKCDNLKRYTDQFYRLESGLHMTKEMIDAGFLFENNGVLIVNEKLSETLNQFIKFCKLKRLVVKHSDIDFKMSI
ncbi:MAG: hypothetical protein DWQ06_07675 [Calditrichaeota bacterium]|nr:MAG: hypothetical protein DWQ06_07675 [Calditrichota bacterium]